MLSTAGPRKQKVFGAVEDEYEDIDVNVDTELLELAKSKSDPAAVAGAYRMQHQGEKFSLRGVKGGVDDIPLPEKYQKREKTAEEIEA